MLLLFLLNSAVKARGKKSGWPCMEQIARGGGTNIRSFLAIQGRLLSHCRRKAFLQRSFPRVNSIKRRLCVSFVVSKDLGSKDLIHKASRGVQTHRWTSWKPASISLRILICPQQNPLLLAVLVSLLLLIIQGAPHLTELLSDLAEGNVRVLFLDLRTMFLGEQHEAAELLLTTGGGPLL